LVYIAATTYVSLTNGLPPLLQNVNWAIFYAFGMTALFEIGWVNRNAGRPVRPLFRWLAGIPSLLFTIALPVILYVAVAHGQWLLLLAVPIYGLSIGVFGGIALTGSAFRFRKS
jgi:hypothetical protein